MLVHSRRRFLGGLACGCAAVAAPWAASPVLATDKPKSEVTAEQAIELLKEGNAAFLKGSCTASATRIPGLAVGQAPFAVIVACSDSRTPPGELFNRGLGELFIIRVAGNTVDSVGLGSIEYGVSVLGASLVLVLGHTQCGGEGREGRSEISGIDRVGGRADPARREECEGRRRYSEPRDTRQCSARRLAAARRKADPRQSCGG